MLGKNASANKIVPALSGVQIASGSTNASNFAGYEFGTLIVASGSVGGTTLIALTRSATSNGTFGTFGASLPAIAACKVVSRSWTLDSSAIFYRLVYDKTGTQSDNISAVIELRAGRVEPAPTQHADVTIYSDVLGG